MGKLILGIDLGTTALKVALFDTSGALQYDATHEYNLLTPQTNWVEAEENVYMGAIKAGLKDMAAKGANLSAVVAIGFSAQGETLFFTDECGNSLRNPIVWMDNRADKQAAELSKKFSNEHCYQVTGQVSIEPCWPASKVLWVKQNQPEIFAKTKKILLIEDYIIAKMTGKFVTEGSLLTSTEYWNINTKKYWEEMLDAIGVKQDMLPTVMESGEAVGKILPETAEWLGISPEAIVTTGCLDQAAGAIGVGNIREGIFSENIGAALAVCAPTSSIKPDPNRNMPVHYFALPNTYMMHTFTTGGMTLRWFRDSFCKLEMEKSEQTGVDTYALMDELAADVPPGSDGLVMLPHLNGSMAPDMNANAKGVFFGFTMLHKKPHFIRAIMESIGYMIRRNIDALKNMGIEVTELRSLGGGSKSPFWNQIKADIIDKDLYIMDCKEAACLGAAILAGKAVGIFDSIESACESMIHVKRVYHPNPENKAVYDQAYEKYKKVFKDLTNAFDL